MSAQLGEWYVDGTTSRVYVVAMVDGKFCLINIHTGITYAGLCESIHEVFSGDAKDFSRVQR
jgi:hypothetical protein